MGVAKLSAPASDEPADVLPSRGLSSLEAFRSTRSFTLSSWFEMLAGSAMHCSVVKS